MKSAQEAKIQSKFWVSWYQFFLLTNRLVYMENMVPVQKNYKIDTLKEIRI
jgi:hypothetical protein